MQWNFLGRSAVQEWKLKSNVSESSSASIVKIDVLRSATAHLYLYPWLTVGAQCPCPRASNGQSCHSSYQHWLWRQRVFETSDWNSILAPLIIREDVIVFIHGEIFKFSRHGINIFTKNVSGFTRI
jgi:hypothetical protein